MAEYPKGKIYDQIRTRLFNGQPFSTYDFIAKMSLSILKDERDRLRDNWDDGEISDDEYKKRRKQRLKRQDLINTQWELAKAFRSGMEHDECDPAKKLLGQLKIDRSPEMIPKMIVAFFTATSKSMGSLLHPKKFNDRNHLIHYLSKAIWREYLNEDPDAPKSKRKSKKSELPIELVEPREMEKMEDLRSRKAVDIIQESEVYDTVYQNAKRRERRVIDCILSGGIRDHKEIAEELNTTPASITTSFCLIIAAIEEEKATHSKPSDKK